MYGKAGHFSLESDTWSLVIVITIFVLRALDTTFVGVFRGHPPGIPGMYSPGRNKQPLLQPQEVAVCVFQILYKRYFKDFNLFSTLLRAQGIIHTSDMIYRYPEGVLTVHR